MSRTVITYGTFDRFHIGHLRLLKRMRELGERGCSIAVRECWGAVSVVRYAAGLGDGLLYGCR
ncbi:adenylyltransferase/cytidyltransferase family protein [Ectopseudomonas chengduensis]|uniref:adenylyltransferase/cytidyltransferase family protein n=1 Tax=Ectopseudomonas mendocina TaxID=300 RepID=UPI001FD35D15|nr:adenylyltransferase/cytidyltransferase family protein [Pseudomonas mendocina]